MKRIKRALIFTLGILPIAAVAAYFTILYQMEFMDAATLELTLE